MNIIVVCNAICVCNRVKTLDVVAVMHITTIFSVWDISVFQAGWNFCESHSALMDTA